MKRKLIPVLCLSMILSLFIGIQPVEAIDFSKNEEKYLKLCSGSSLGRNESTCRDFNDYLKKKNSQLKKDISNTKDKISETKDNIDTVLGELNDLNSQISKKQREINYLTNTITTYENDIKKRDGEVKDRMYAMQSFSNSNSLIDFIFGAESFGDFFSRISSINEITAYDEEMIQEVTRKKQEVENQKKTVVAAKAVIEAQKKQQATLQARYQSLYNQQSNLLSSQQQEQKDTNKAQGQLDAALAQLVRETQSSSTGVRGDSAVGQAIANKALTRQGYMYLWGGCHTMAQIQNPNTTRFDCSGLVSWAYYQAGVNIGVNYTGTLMSMGKSISASQLQAGDIIMFYATGTRRVCHVGIAINNNQMVHAPQTGEPVQVANLTQGWRDRVQSYRRLY